MIPRTSDELQRVSRMMKMWAEQHFGFLGRTPDYLNRALAYQGLSRLREAENKYLFEVSLQANKLQIKDAVERLFNVSVVGVNTSIVRGRPKRLSVGRCGGAPLFSLSPRPCWSPLSPAPCSSRDGIRRADWPA